MCRVPTRGFSNACTGGVCADRGAIQGAAWRRHHRLRPRHVPTGCHMQPHAVVACCYTRRCRFRQYTPTIRPKNGSRAALIEPCLPSALRSFVSGLRCGGAGLVLIVLSDLSRAPPDTDAPANVHRPAAVPAKAMQNDAL